MKQQTMFKIWLLLCSFRILRNVFDKSILKIRAQYTHTSARVRLKSSVFKAGVITKSNKKPMQFKKSFDRAID